MLPDSSDRITMSLTELSGAPQPEPATTAEKPARAARRTSPFGALLLPAALLRRHPRRPVPGGRRPDRPGRTPSTPQLDSILYGDQLTVAQVGDRPNCRWPSRSAPRATRTPTAASPRCSPATATGPPRWCSRLPELGENQHTVYVDPYTGESQGQLTTWFGLHARSPPGWTTCTATCTWATVGEHYSELAASWLWVMALGGVILWWRRRGAARAAARHLLVPDLSAGKGVRRTRGLARHHRHLAHRRTPLPLRHRPDLVPLRRRELRRRSRRA